MPSRFKSLFSKKNIMSGTEARLGTGIHRVHKPLYALQHNLNASMQQTTFLKSVSYIIVTVIECVALLIPRFK